MCDGTNRAEIFTDGVLFAGIVPRLQVHLKLCFVCWINTSYDMTRTRSSSRVEVFFDCIKN